MKAPAKPGCKKDTAELGFLLIVAKSSISSWKII